MSEGSLTNTEKAAVLLMSIGKDHAGEVMKFLSEMEVKKLSRALMSVQQVGRDLQQNVASEFANMLKASETVVVDGQEFAREVIVSAFGDSAGDSLMAFISGARQEPLSVVFKDIPPAIVQNVVQTEHPQTVAFLLSKMRPEQASEFLSVMKEELQLDVLVRLSQLNTVKSEVIDEVREVLKSHMRGGAVGGEESVNGTQSVAEILNFVDRANSERIFSELEELHPELAEQIRNLMFTFEDLLALDDRAMQTVLKEVPREELVIALKTASQELRGKIFKNISQRAAQMLQEDLETLGPTKLKDVEKSQQGIIDIVRRLEAEGKIQLATGGDDVLV